MQDKITMLEACKYSDLAKYTKIFNLATLDYHLWIYLNPQDVRDAYFIKATETGPGADNVHIYPDTFVRDSQCWIRVNSGYLNNSIGKHILKLSFVDRYTDTDFSLYASYYIQNDNPDKPYVYMPQQDEGDVESPTYTTPQRTFTEYKDT